MMECPQVTYNDGGWVRLEVENLDFVYRSTGVLPQRVFSGFSLRAEAGKVTALIGEQGTGKSTLLQIMAGLLPPESGSILVDGIEPENHQDGWRGVRQRMGFAFQFPEQQFFCETVLDELLYTCRQYRIPPGDELTAATDALVRLQLDADILRRSPFSLSMGEARRVAVASLLLHQPDTLLLDEPTAGLDQEGTGVVLDLLLDLKTKGRTIVLATHDHSVVTTMADEVAVLGEDFRMLTVVEYDESDLSRHFIY